MIDSGLVGSTDFSFITWGSARAEDALEIPTLSHISPSKLSIRRKHETRNARQDIPGDEEDSEEEDQPSAEVPPRLYLTQCIDLMVSLKSIHPQTRELNFIIRNSKLHLTGLWVN